jgi:hypothetical protein
MESGNLSKKPGTHSIMISIGVKEDKRGPGEHSEKALQSMVTAGKSNSTNISTKLFNHSWF